MSALRGDIFFEGEVSGKTGVTSVERGRFELLSSMVLFGSCFTGVNGRTEEPLDDVDDSP